MWCLFVALMMLSSSLLQLRCSAFTKRLSRLPTSRPILAYLGSTSTSASIHHRKRPSTARSSTATDSAHATTRGAPFLITTPIYYVNGQPHLGHAYTSIVSDIIARFHRKDGRDVFFLTGTDEHGQKVEQSAIAASKTPIEFATAVSAQFRQLTEVLGCSNDDFIRTTESRHKAGVAELWRRLEENGHIYLGAYEGWYSIRDEAYYAETELVNGKAPTGADVTWVKEESYFFRLSAFTQPLLDYYEKHPDFIGPKGRRNEVIAFVSQEGGLKDLSISRTTFSWGIPVPGNPNHVVYVWLDALTNYISALGYPKAGEKGANFERLWPAALHVVGKDILRFHAVFWPAFLMGAGLPLPKRVFAHGWWTKDGEKMSKSIGNVLDPLQLVEQYGLDYLRYFLIAEVPFGQDGDFSDDAFALRVNSDLANDIGNLAQRVLTMVEKHCDGRLPEPGPLKEEDQALLDAATEALPAVRKHMETQNMRSVCESIVSVAKLGNRYIDAQAPWALRKTDPARMNTVLYVLAEVLRKIAVLLDPITPTSASALLDQIGASGEYREFSTFASQIPSGSRVGKVQPLFPKVEKRDPASPAPSAAVGGGGGGAGEAEAALASMTIEDLSARIGETGQRIRDMKKEKADKAEVGKVVAVLQQLKAVYKDKAGVEWASPQ